MTKQRKIWLDFWGSVRKSSHVHHIKPKSEGGKDVIGNLIELHPDDHYLIHKLRGDKQSMTGVLIMRDGFSEETLLKLKKQGEKRRVCSIDKASEICEAYATGLFSTIEMAKGTGLSKGTIHNIIHGIGAYK